MDDGADWDDTVPDIVPRVLSPLDALSARIARLEDRVLQVDFTVPRQIYAGYLRLTPHSSI